MLDTRHGVAVIGCGRIGARRAQCVAADGRTRVVALVDPVISQAQALAARYGGRAAEGWREALGRPEVEIVVVATPNAYLSEIGCAALERHRHVLLEKPMGRNLSEARTIFEATRRSEAIFKVGFNHRYHPAIRELLERVDMGAIGSILNVRARYGHGGRPGIEDEWRGDAELAGGGHLLDQGVHLADLLHALLGEPYDAFGVLQTAWWPLGALEDNAFGTFRYRNRAVAQIHVSMTQWKNLFSLEVFGETGALLVEGLGGSYGPERLVHWRRRPEGGPPEEEVLEFAGEDDSWAAEWRDFVDAVEGAPLLRGGAADGLAAMRMIDALYRSAAEGRTVELEQTSA